MRNTLPEPPIEQRDTHGLIEDLCLALRDVGVRDSGLPDDERGVASIEGVRRLHAELEKRGADYHPRLARLTEETGWQMEQLLRECLNYPEVVPYVRERDGVRRAFRCPVCRQGEFPDREGLQLCDACMERSAESIQSRVPWGGLLLLRLYNETYWCRHANAETVMAAFDDYETLGDVWCAQCIAEERERRAGIVGYNGAT